MLCPEVKFSKNNEIPMKCRRNMAVTSGSIKTDDMKARVVEFAKSNGFASQDADMLVSTVSTLKCFLDLADKIIPLRSFYKIVQWSQREAALSVLLSDAMASSLVRNKDSGEQTEIQKRFEAELRARGATLFAAHLLRGEQSIAQPLNPYGLDLAMVNKCLSGAAAALCSPSQFVIAIAFLWAELSVVGAIFYLKNKSGNVKETKRNRIVVDICDPIHQVLVVSALSRQEVDCGAIELADLTAGYNYLAKLHRLSTVVAGVASWIELRKQNKEPVRKADICLAFNLTSGEYNRVLAMGIDSGILIASKRRKTADNKYVLTSRNHQLVVEYAERLDLTPTKTINQLLTDFFKIVASRKIT